MFTKYIRGIRKEACPLVLSVTDLTMTVPMVTSIQRNNVRRVEQREAIDIYVRARNIYYRARRQRPVRAASIF
ncbi:MAG: hypothetical protein ABI857_01665 [Acidobacteriota bacterium]